MNAWLRRPAVQVHLAQRLPLPQLRRRRLRVRHVVRGARRARIELPRSNRAAAVPWRAMRRGRESGLLAGGPPLVLWEVEAAGDRDPGRDLGWKWRSERMEDRNVAL